MLGEGRNIYPRRGNVFFLQGLEKPNQGLGQKVKEMKNRTPTIEYLGLLSLGVVEKFLRKMANPQSKF